MFIFLLLSHNNQCCYKRFDHKRLGRKAKNSILGERTSGSIERSWILPRYSFESSTTSYRLCIYNTKPGSSFLSFFLSGVLINEPEYFVLIGRRNRILGDERANINNYMLKFARCILLISSWIYLKTSATPTVTS